MKQYVEPRGWSDLAPEKKESLIASFSTVGLIDLDLEASSNELLDTLRKSNGADMPFYTVKKVIENRDPQKVAAAIETREQGNTLVSMFGSMLAERFPTAVLKPFKGSEKDNESPSL